MMLGWQDTTLEMVVGGGHIEDGGRGLTRVRISCLSVIVRAAVCDSFVFCGFAPDRLCI